MIRGGMFAVDLPLFYAERQRHEFTLRFDRKGQYDRMVLTNNGRTATTYVFRYGIRISEEEEVLLPEYNCISVINAVEAAKAKFSFYQIKENFEIDFDDLEQKITDRTKVLYVIHYFGVPYAAETVKRLKEIAERYHLVIVEDLTQTLLCGETDRIGFGDYVVSSVRKWFPITDGGIAAARNGVPFEMVPLSSEEDASISKQMKLSLMKKHYAEGSLSNIAPYLEMEKEANKTRYIDFAPRQITDLSRVILEKCSIEQAVKKRCDNYRYLYEKLETVPQINLLSAKLDENCYDFVPFGLLIETADRDGLYRYLAEHHIVGEIQWVLAKQYYTPSPYADYISEHSLMLQIDQRYGRDDMDVIYETIKTYISRF